MAFTVLRRTPLAPDLAWASVTDLAEHTHDVPLTDVVVPDGGLVLGSEVVAWTRLGPLAVADRMLVTAVEPGRRLRLVKVGRWLHGWADITVVPDPEFPGGARVLWFNTCPGVSPCSIKHSRHHESAPQFARHRFQSLRTAG